MELFRTKKAANVTFNQLIVEKITLCNAENKINTRKKYQALLSKLEKHYGILPVSQLTPQFANEFKRKIQLDGCNNSSIASYLSLVRAIWNYAAYKGYVDGSNYLFRRKAYEIDRCELPKPAKRTECYLTKDEMGKLYNWFITNNPTRKHDITKKRLVGLFLFSYLGSGANLADLLRITFNQDYFRSKGRILSFIRHKVEHKTQIKVRIPLIDKLQRVLDYIADKPSQGGYVLGSYLDGVNPENEEQMAARILYLNGYASKLTKQVANSIGIDAPVSLTYARHTYSTVMHHSNVPFAVVEKNMGHSCSGIAYNYIGDVSIDDLFKYNELLLD